MAGVLPGVAPSTPAPRKWSIWGSHMCRAVWWDQREPARSVSHHPELLRLWSNGRSSPEWVFLASASRPRSRPSSVSRSSSARGCSWDSSAVRWLGVPDPPASETQATALGSNLNETKARVAVDHRERACSGSWRLAWSGIGTGTQCPVGVHMAALSATAPPPDRRAGHGEAPPDMDPSAGSPSPRRVADPSTTERAALGEGLRATARAVAGGCSGAGRSSRSTSEGGPWRRPTLSIPVSAVPALGDGEPVADMPSPVPTAGPRAMPIPMRSTTVAGACPGLLCGAVGGCQSALKPGPIDQAAGRLLAGARSR